MSTESVATSLAGRLRAETAEAHARAERHALQGRMVRGAATRAEYAGWLVQLERVWRAIDGALVEVSRRDAGVGAMVKPYHAHGERVRADLAHLRGMGVDPTPSQPVGAAERLAGWIEAAGRSGDVAVLGAWYVLEGSANGGQYIARALGPALGLPGPEGLRSLDPHGPEQRPRWQAWREALDVQAFSDEERARIIEAARRTFEAIEAVMNEMAAGAMAATGPAARG